MKMPAPMFHSPAIVHHILDCDPYKQSNQPGHLYVCQPYSSLQIIQLVEASPPPPRISSIIPSSSSPAPSSSCPSSSDDDEEDCSSYCSSLITPGDSSHAHEPVQWTDDTYNTRMKRVHAWRDGFVKATCSLSDARTSPLKRKMNSQHQPDDDAVSHSSKRSRSRDGHSISRLTGHPCPACDATFPSASSLRDHGHAPDIPEACRVAVEYNFE